MSWKSTVAYYQIINETVKEDRGGLHSAKILLYRVDFAEIEAHQASGAWDKSAEALGNAGRRDSYEPRLPLYLVPAYLCSGTISIQYPSGSVIK